MTAKLVKPARVGGVTAGRPAGKGRPARKEPIESASPGGLHKSAAYHAIEDLIAAERCVLLDGGMATELPQTAGRSAPLDELTWGTRALTQTPEAVLDVHRRYVEVGCDVISTNTWGLASALAGEGSGPWSERTGPVHWMDVARRGLRLALEAVSEGKRAQDCAIAFSLNGDLDSDEGRETVRLLKRLFTEDEQRPDLILLETLSLVTPSLEDIVELLVETGLPVWISFRRCRHGLCGVYGQHWGGPEGDVFGRAARRFEEKGVQALLINCIPPDHVQGMVPYLRDFTDLPLGVYPNLGYFTDRGWRYETGVGGDEYAEMALEWREEGAQIIGGCCGVGPEHIGATRKKLEGTRPGRGRREQDAAPANGSTPAAEARPVAWTDSRQRRLFPLQFPDLAVDPGVFSPGEASFMAWRYLYREGIGAHQRCLDVGCGTGILAIQLALNGAAHVRALDIDERAVANTLANAFRNGVEDRVSAEAVDIFPWVPEERYEVVMACLWQIPTDPFERVPSHRQADYWGRNTLDQLIARLPAALASEGVAYIVHLSILSQERTAQLLDAAGFTAEVVDYTIFEFPSVFTEGREQIARVEALSDAYHIGLGDRDALVAYLLEVTHKPGNREPAQSASGSTG